MAPGDIVRHADYPQWGCGYVIRAKKASSDVFFRWGGKRRIDAGEPLEPPGRRGSRPEFFALCAGLSASSWSRGHHSVYAIELDRAVWRNRAFRERNPGGAAGGCLYVGVTGLTPEARSSGTGPGRSRPLRPRARRQAAARSRRGILAPAVPDRGLHGAEARRLAAGAGVRGVAELMKASRRLHGDGATTPIFSDASTRSHSIAPMNSSAAIGTNGAS